MSHKEKRQFEWNVKSYFLEKKNYKKKNIINLSSAEYAHNVHSVNSESAKQNLQQTTFIFFLFFIGNKSRHFI